MLKKRLLNFRGAVKTTLMGNTLEWYDYSSFGYFIPIIHQIFFPALDNLSALMQVFLIYGIGQVTRPIGGVIFGFIADRWGRRISLLISIMIMTVPMIVIAVMPTYLQIGIAAVFIFTAMRLIQGISAGGELPVISTFLVESSPKIHRGFFGSFSMLGFIIGLLFGLFEYTLIHLNLSEETIYRWGWRMPYVFGILIGYVSYYLRKGLSESPLFRQIEVRSGLSKDPVLQMLKKNKKALVNLIGLTCLLTMCATLLFVTLKAYLVQYVKMPLMTAIALDFFMLIIVLVLTPFMGKISDKYGHRKIAQYAAIGFIIFSYPFYMLLNQGLLISQMLAVLGFAILFSSYSAPVPVLCCDLFPTSVRVSGIALGANLAVAFLGGFAPFVAIYLIRKFHDPNIPAYFLIGAAIVSLLCLFNLKKQRLYLTAEA
jgi:MHS family proline/betaine transporter-like MFS transporter